MEIAMLLAFIVGYGGGLLAGYAVHQKILKIKINAPLTRKIIIILGVISIFPALFIGTVIGGTYGGGVGEETSIALGYGSAGVPVGLGIGLFSVVALTIVVFSIMGMLLGNFITGVYKQNAT